jgi:hypothetical protein
MAMNDPCLPSDQLATDRLTRDPGTIAALSGSFALADKLIERIEPALLWIDHEPSRVHRKAYDSVRAESERIEHGFGDCQHDRAANLAKSHYVPHGINLRDYLET